MDDANPNTLTDQHLIERMLAWGQARVDGEESPFGIQSFQDFEIDVFGIPAESAEEFGNILYNCSPDHGLWVYSEPMELLSDQEDWRRVFRLLPTVDGFLLQTVVLVGGEQWVLYCCQRDADGPVSLWTWCCGSVVSPDQQINRDVLGSTGLWAIDIARRLGASVVTAAESECLAENDDELLQAASENRFDPERDWIVLWHRDLDAAKA